MLPRKDSLFEMLSVYGTNTALPKPDLEEEIEEKNYHLGEWRNLSHFFYWNGLQWSPCGHDLSDCSFCSSNEAWLRDPVQEDYVAGAEHQEGLLDAEICHRTSRQATTGCIC